MMIPGPDNVGGGGRRSLRARLADSRPLLAVELRPPRRDLLGAHALEAWIDTYHAIRTVASMDTVVFLTDQAVGSDEEENLTHLVRNIGGDAPRNRVVPFLTLKHTLEYCLRYAQRAGKERFPGVVLLGGDTGDGVPRCLPHAWQLRERLRREQPGLLLGGWANPYRDPSSQVDYLLEHAGSLDFVLTQVLSHHRRGPVEAFLDEARRRGLAVPMFAGVFYYRSARRRTLTMLARYLPVPRDDIVRDFRERGLGAEEVATETLIALQDLGFNRFYLSNLETGQAAARLRRIGSAAGLSVDPPAPPPRSGRRRGRR